VIADGVPVAVVDRLEAVEVDHQQSDHFAAAFGARQNTAQFLEKQRPIGQPGERIVVRQLAQFGFALTQAIVRFSQFQRTLHNALFERLFRLLQGLHRLFLGAQHLVVRQIHFLANGERARGNREAEQERLHRRTDLAAILGDQVAG